MDNAIATISLVSKQLESLVLPATRKNLNTMTVCLQLLDSVKTELTNKQAQSAEGVKSDG